MEITKGRNRRFKKELIGFIFVVAIIFCGYCGCEAYIDKQVEEWNAIEWVGISNAVNYRNKLHCKTVDEIKKYEVTQNFYSSEIYYNELNEQEKFVYDTYKYAYENNITHLFFGEDIISECNYTLTELLIIFSLDTPLMEQNLVSGEDECTYTVNKDFLYRNVERELKGRYINIDNFTKEKAEKKQKAVKQAKKIKFDFTDDMSEFDKAKVIYTYLGENVNYADNESEDKSKGIMETHYLYDAICKNETNCDGFANAFSLLCSMNGIKNFEKKDNPPEGVTGHTWNSVLLDGVWYNVDATSADSVLNDNWTKDLLSRFAYSDKLQTENQIHSKIIPSCEDDRIYVGCTLKSCDEDGAARKVAEAYRSTNDDFVVIVIKKATKDEISALLNEVTNYHLYKSLQFSTIEGRDQNLVYIKR